VYCSVEELERREHTRGDRQIGLAREQQATIHNSVIYDIEVDTSILNLEECAMNIKMKMKAFGAPKAITSLQARLNRESL
jgi:chloramphenicol 3-O phosphotransferase